MYTYDGSQSKIGLWCHSVNPLIYRVDWDFWNIKEKGCSRFFLKKWGGAIDIKGLSMEEGSKHWFSLVYMDFAAITVHL